MSAPASGSESGAERLDGLSAVKLALLARRARGRGLDPLAREPIAVVGLGCRFPGAASPAAYWRLLAGGVDAVTEVPRDRWDADAYYDPDPEAPGKTVSRWGGFLDDVAGFDAGFFGIAPREVVSMDPQQRLVLEVAWEALEAAGQAPHALAGSATGVFLGASSSDYSSLLDLAGGDAPTDPYRGTGNALSVIAGRLSHTLGLQGPTLTVDTACSSSLVAVHLACRSLRGGECDLALAGGVNVLLLPEVTVLLSRSRAMSATGRCRTFDAAADGYVRSEGCGVVVLKRLSDALAAGDPVLALLRGSAVNHDGRSSGLTVPNGPAQERVVRRALADAGVAPAEVAYVEAHGTGTPLGDPIEAGALAAVFGGTGRHAARPLLIGSAKTNIGHLEAAAGVAGLIKVVLALCHGEVPPHLHFRQVNPRIALAPAGLAVPAAAVPWPAGESRRIAGVSSFGLSGINAHVVVEEAPATALEPPAAGRPLHLLPLSARSERVLCELAGRYAAHLAAHPEAAAADVCWTAGAGRSHFEHRLAVWGADAEELRRELAAFAAAPGSGSAARHGRAPEETPRVAFLFTGQGAQYAGMGRGLYETEPVFRAALDRCAELLRPCFDLPLTAVLFDSAGGPLERTAYAQPALFALEHALAELLAAWGIRPAAVLGHSVGEYAAACVAGVFDLADGLRLTAERGRLMQGLPPGAMAAVFAGEERVAAAVAPLGGEVAIAAVNAPAETVISGAPAAVAAAREALAALGIRSRVLAASQAFHSPLVEPVLAPLERAAAGVSFRPPRVPLVSNLTGRLAAAADLARPAAWSRHARETVRFADGLEALRATGCSLFVEIGPTPTLTALARKGAAGESVWVPTLRRGRDDLRQMLETAAALYVHGAAVDWAGFGRGGGGRRIELPTYPFERRRYWAPVAVPGHRRPASRQDPPTLLGRRLASPLLRETVYESRLDPEALPWLGDHRFFGQIVVPGACFAAMALAAGAAPPGPDRELADVTFEEILALPDRGGATLQLVLAPEGPDELSFRLIRLEERDGAEHGSGSAPWTLHAAGRLRAATAVPADAPAAEEIRAGLPEEVPGDSLYERLAALEADLGPSFRWIERFWRREGEALCRLRSLRPDDAEGNGPLPPGLLDACFQALGVSLPLAPAGGPRLHVPAGFAALRLHGRPAGGLWCHARLRPGAAAGRSVLGDVRLFDGAGRTVAAIDGLRLVPAGRGMVPPGLRPSAATYRLAWQAVARGPEEAAAGAAPGGWLILADRGGAGEALARALGARNQSVTLVPAGEDGPGVLPALLRDGAHPGGGWRGAVHLRGLDAAPPGGLTPAALAVDPALLCGTALDLVQALAGAAPSPPPRLWLVTRGGQAVGESGDLQPLQALLWGLGSVVAREHPELRCSRLDLDPGLAPDTAETAEELCRELLADGREDQVAWRGGVRYGARLVPDRSGAGGPERLEVPVRGLLDNLTYAPLQRRPPGRGEIEIEVRAVGLNFRDVLNVLGMYPGDAGPLGLEGAGRIAAVGEGVADLRVGDEVMTIHSGLFGSHATLDAAGAVPKPARLSWAEAATVPVAFLTARFALFHFARLQAGERVLIHAGAGGVGLAAVQLALRAGAEVFATAGSPEKRDYLRSLGVRHTLDSRTLDFAGEVLARTAGRGVDVVLNSLTGEAIPHSLAALAPGGRFAEIGKIGAWDPGQVAQERPDVSYLLFDLDQEHRRSPGLLRSMLLALAREVEDGTVAPLPHRVFPWRGAADAFRHMAGARHIGKIVVEPAPAALDAGPALRADATYLVTGGLGALGLEVAAWMVERGARNLVLVGRSASSAAAAGRLDGLERRGARVRVMQADVAAPADVERVLAEVRRSLPPLGGIVHAAGVLDDGPLLDQDRERFARVLAPKVAGAWNLHAATAGERLDFFVLFSSAAALLGPPGQGSYAAANAFLDLLAHHRRRQGLAALSIGWGPWQGAGMAAAAGDRAAGRWEAAGVTPFPPVQALEILARSLSAGLPQVAALAVDWPRFTAGLPGGGPPLLSSLAAAADAAAESPLLQQLRGAPAGQREPLLAAYLSEQVARVLQLGPAESVAPRASLTEMGMDSLMVIELRNRLQADLRRPLPATLVFDYPNVESLARHLAAAMAPAGEPASPALRAPAEEALLEQIERLSEDEAEALLLQRLDALSEDTAR